MTPAGLPPMALYLHFPWCVAKCPYCDFNSYALQGELPEEAYVRALAEDLAAQASPLADRAIVSVFLGGGTPSLFSPQAIGRVLETAGRYLEFVPQVEVTLEANPGTIERGRFAEYRAAGITRVSLGAQSFADAQLAALGRIHSANETRRAAAELHAAGLENFNVDLMYGLPAQTPAEALADLEAALELEPAHLSHYHLTLEPGTLFGARPPPELPAEDAVEAMLDACQARLAAAGYAQYEVSGYARQGARCRHNLNYWEFGDYLGVGAGAHGKVTSGPPGAAVRIERTAQLREPRRYLATGASGLLRREVPQSDRAFEFMMNALRLLDGFEESLWPARTGLSWSTVQPIVEELCEEGLLERLGTRVRPTSRGLRFLNDVLLRFLPPGSTATGFPESQGSTRG